MPSWRIKMAKPKKTNQAKPFPPLIYNLISWLCDRWLNPIGFETLKRFLFVSFTRRYRSNVLATTMVNSEGDRSHSGYTPASYTIARSVQRPMTGNPVLVTLKQPSACNFGYHVPVRKADWIRKTEVHTFNVRTKEKCSKNPPVRISDGVQKNGKSLT